MTTPDNVTPIGQAGDARADNVLDLDYELPELRLQGASLNRYGIEDGVLTEPSDEQVGRWRRDVYRALRAERRGGLNLPDNPTNADVLDALAEHDWSASSRLQTDAFAILCGAVPPYDEDENGKRREVPRPVPPTAPTPPGAGPGRAPDRADFDDDAAFTAANDDYQRRAAMHTATLAAHAAATVEHDEKLAEFEAALTAWEARWSGGYPTRQQLGALPWRAKARVFGKLSGWFLDPTGEPGTATSG